MLGLRRNRLLHVTLLCICPLSSCSGGDDPTDVEVEDDATETVTVTAAGGETPFMGGEVTLSVPEGALTAPVDIAVSRRDASGLDGSVPGSVFEFGPDGLEFQEPVALTVRYEVDRLPTGALQNALRLIEYTDGTPELVLGSRLDSDGRTVWAEIDGFSSYGAGEASDEALMGGIGEVANAIEAEDAAKLAEFERVRDALREDIDFVGPRLEAQCVATNMLAAKVFLTNQLIRIESVKERFGFDDVRTIGSLCGGLMDEARTVLEPESATLRPGDQIQLSATILGPDEEELVGPIEWGASPEDVVSVDQTGLVVAHAFGDAGVIATPTDLPQIFGSVTVVVMEDLVVEVSPPELKVAATRTGVLDAVVRTEADDELVEDAFVEWTVGDPDLFRSALVGDEGIYNRRITLEARGRGTTEVRACVVDTDFCVTVPLEAVFYVQGDWEFAETLEVDVDPPANEACEVRGTAQLTQVGDVYSGTSNETVTCTFDPGDGSDPEVTVVELTAEIRNGRIDGTGFYHETFYATEACRTSGTLAGSGSDGWADSATGTTECLDDDDFYSTGPMSGNRR